MTDGIRDRRSECYCWQQSSADNTAAGFILAESARANLPVGCPYSTQTLGGYSVAKPTDRFIHQGARGDTGVPNRSLQKAERAHASC